MELKRHALAKLFQSMSSCQNDSLEFAQFDSIYFGMSWCAVPMFRLAQACFAAFSIHLINTLNCFENYSTKIQKKIYFHSVNKLMLILINHNEIAIDWCQHK